MLVTLLAGCSGISGLVLSVIVILSSEVVRRAIKESGIDGHREDVEEEQLLFPARVSSTRSRRLVSFVGWGMIIHEHQIMGVFHQAAKAILATWTQCSDDRYLC